MKLEGKLTANNLKFAIVVSRFNEFITSTLVEGATKCFIDHGGVSENLDIVKVPGAYELGLATKALLEKKPYDGIVVLGCVIRGETSHYDLVCNETARACQDLMLQTGTPIGFGLVTTENLDQAMARADLDKGNKGSEACLAAIEMVNLLKQIND